jgi:hypothetical protein
MVYIQMLFALIFDKLIWGTIPEILSIIGSFLILGSAIYVVLTKQSLMKKAELRERDEEDRGLSLIVCEEHSELS